MRFTLAAVVLATAVIADSTTYVTKEITITSCAPEVTNCPARSTSTSTYSYPVTVPTTTAPATHTAYTTTLSTIYACPPSVTNCPLKTPTVTTIIIPVTPTAKVNSTIVAPTKGPAVVTVTVNACPASTSTVPTTIVPVTVANKTTAATTPKFTGAASTMTGSVFIAAFAGLAAVLLV